MKAKWNDLLNELHGSFGEGFYARQIPGNGEYAAVCKKPELSKKTKKAKAEHPTVRGFAELIAESKAILNDPVRRAEWQARYDEALRKARKYDKPIQGRLYDYIKHELSEERKKNAGECRKEGD